MVVVAAFNLSLSHMPLHQYLFIFHIYLTLSTHPLIHNLCITRVPPSLYLHPTQSFTPTVTPAPSHNLSNRTHTTQHLNTAHSTFTPPAAIHHVSSLQHGTPQRLQEWPMLLWSVECVLPAAGVVWDGWWWCWWLLHAALLTVVC